MFTCVSTIAMFYIMCMIAVDDSINEMPGAYSIYTILMFGTIVIGLFSAIFLFYTNSFLMKRRKKELGLYNILGMEKNHIAKILLYETLITGIVTIFLGLLSGILFSKLIFLLLFKMLHFSVPMGFYISRFSMIVTTALFCGIFLLTLLFNLMQIHLSNPIELLKGSNTGEREPKSKRMITLIGLLTTGVGYFIALTTESPLEAIYLFFIAVVLVIIGTYCLFTAGSIALLKTLRKNKNYYYRTKHFTSISGMIYRMKQNAVGLANICILSTAVLVMVSTTVSLYISVDEELANICHNDIAITFFNLESEDYEKHVDAVKAEAEKQNRVISNMLNYNYLEIYAEKSGESFMTDGGNRVSNSNTSDLYFITANEYEKLSGINVSLAENEVLVYSSKGNISDSFKLFNKEYKVKNKLNDFPVKGDYSAVYMGVYYIVVSDDEVLSEIYEEQINAFGENANKLENYLAFDIDGTKEEKISFADSVYNEINESEYNFESKQELESEFYSMIGGFLFLGLFLGLLFLTATVLIIYYKQISEGYDDKERFDIMQKVGMSRNEVKVSIRSQIIKVFFLPLIMSIIHIAAAFKMITKLLALFNLTNVLLFLKCTVATIIVFAVFYGIVYSLTARVYYKIVQ